VRRVSHVSWLVVVALAGGIVASCTSSPTTPSTTSSTASSPSIPSSGTVTAVSVSGVAPAVGGSAQFPATATLADASTRQVTSDATWQSSNASAVTVSGGTATGVAAGEADISATYQNVTGKLHVTVAPVSPPTVNAVSVAGTTPAVGTTTQFNATAFLSDNTSKPVTNVAIWRSSNASAATVNAGQVRGIAAGETDISATYQGVTGTLHLAIGSSSSPSPPATPPTVTLVSVSGPTPGIGGTVRLFAMATLSDHTSQDVTSLASWSSSNASVAIASSGGLVTGVAAGPTDISAT
jgi:hypothetical protein